MEGISKRTAGNCFRFSKLSYAPSTVFDSLIIYETCQKYVPATDMSYLSKGRAKTVTVAEVKSLMPFADLMQYIAKVNARILKMPNHAS